MTAHAPLDAAVRPPAVLPRLAAAFAAGAAALVAPLWIAAGIGVAAAVVVGRLGTRAERRGAWWGAFGVVVASVLLTPVWLRFLAAVDLREAWSVSAALAVRLGAVLLAGTALSLALPPRSWLAALRRFPRLALALSLTFRQVPELARDVERIRLAQRARGLHLGWGVWRPRAVALPLFHRALQRADRMGEALALAGWGARGRAPVLRPRVQAADAVWGVVAVVLVAVAVWL